MSHYSLLVQVPGHIKKNKIESYVNTKMEPFEEKEPYDEKNPNKWDWYEVGGRWNGLLLTKDGKRVNIARKKEFDLKTYQEMARVNAQRTWDRFFAPEATPPNPIEILLNDFRKDDTKESYLNRHGKFSTFAVLDKSGKWHQKGEMGWFGIYQPGEEPEEIWQEKFVERFIEPLEDDDWLVVVDCHI